MMCAKPNFVGLLLVLMVSAAVAGPPRGRDTVQASYGSDDYGFEPYSYDDPIVEYQAGDTFYEEGCETGCGPGWDCSSYLALPRWSAGVEFTLLRPHFENNVAFTTLDSDGDTFETVTDTQFDYDRELAPRVWIEALSNDCLGIRAIWWNYDHPAATATGTPPDNGFGRIDHPDFGNVDLSTTVPGSQYIAMSDIDATTIDLEVTKSLQVGRAGWLTGFGLRYGEIKQLYSAELRSEANVQQGTINFDHRVEGIGPTISIRTQRPWTDQLSIFGIARGALLFGDGESTLTAVEDLDLDDQLQTTQTSARDDLLPIGELQLGLQWTPPALGIWSPYIHIAMEGQLWSGVGDASSEDGNLGFYGFNVALGFDF